LLVDALYKQNKMETRATKRARLNTWGIEDVVPVADLVTLIWSYDDQGWARQLVYTFRTLDFCQNSTEAWFPEYLPLLKTEALRRFLVPWFSTFTYEVAHRVLYALQQGTGHLGFPLPPLEVQKQNQVLVGDIRLLDRARNVDFCLHKPMNVLETWCWHLRQKVQSEDPALIIEVPAERRPLTRFNLQSYSNRWQFTRLTRWYVEVRMFI